jgi:hypothetical protein
MSESKTPTTELWSVRLTTADSEAFSNLAAASLIGRKELLLKLIRKRVRLRSYPAAAALGHLIATLTTIRASGSDAALTRLLEEQIKDFVFLTLEELR